MKNKKLIIIITAAVLIVAVIAIIFAVKPKNDTETVSEQTTVTVTESTVPATAPTEVLTEEKTSVKTSEKGNTAEVPKFVQGKYWYLYDDDKLTVYVFEFDKNNQVNLAYFNKENVEGLDAEYTKGFSVYSYSDGKITVKDLPDEFPISSFSFEIKDGKVMQGKTELEAMDSLSLDDALRHFV